MTKKLYIRTVQPPTQCMEDGITDCLDCPDKICRYDKKNKYAQLWTLATKLEKCSLSQSDLDIMEIICQINNWISNNF